MRSLALVAMGVAMAGAGCAMSGAGGVATESEAKNATCSEINVGDKRYPDADSTKEERVARWVLRHLNDPNVPSDEAKALVAVELSIVLTCNAAVNADFRPFANGARLPENTGYTNTPGVTG